MAQATERLLVRIDATTEQLRREMRSADQAMGRSEGKIKGSLNKIDRQFTKLNRSLSGFKAALGGIGFGLATREIIQAADSMAKMRGQLALVTNSQEELNSVYQKTLSLANETGQSTESTVNLYARLARATEEVELSQDELLGITKTINQSFVVSGATAQEASAAIIQLSQGFAAGVLRGEEFNSVNEQAPRIMGALAESLGVTRGELREMAKEGKLTTEIVVGALQDMSGTIDAEFKQMPITIGRVFQTISNDVNDSLGSVDTAPLIDSMEDLRAVLSSPEFKAGITSLAEGLISITTAATKAATGFANFSKFLGEELSRQIHGIAAGDIPALEGKLYDLNKELAFYEASNHGASDGVKALREKISALEEKLRISRDILSDSAENTESYKDETEELGEETEKTAHKTEALTKEQIKQAEALRKSRLEIQEYISELELEYRLISVGERDRERLTAQRKLNESATSEERQRVDELTTAMWDAAHAEEALAVVTTKATKVTRTWGDVIEDAREKLDPFTHAMGEAISRIDEAFANAWKGAFDSFEDFADGLKNSFKSLLAELAHAAITKPILVSLGASLGLPQFAQAANLGMGAGGIMDSLSGLGSLASKGYDAITGLFGAGASIAGASSAIGVGAGAAAGVGGGLGTVGAVGGAAGASAGAGGLMATLGAAAPWALGGLALASTLGVFDKKPSDKRQRSSIDLQTGNISYGGFSGDKFSQENRDASQQIAEQLAAIATSLGVNAGSITAQVGGRTGLRYRIGGAGVERQINGQQFSNVEALLADAMNQLVSASETLTPEIKNLIRGFHGSAEETMAFAGAIVSMSEMVKKNPIERAIEDFASSQEEAGSTLYATYQNQLEATRSLIMEFDGSAGSTQRLSQAMSQTQQVAYQLAMTIQQMGADLDGLFTGSAQSIRESQMTEEERIAAWKAERRELKQSLPSLLDPDLINSAARQIEALNTQIFNALGPNAQAGQAEAFAVYAERTNEIAQSALERSLRVLTTEQERVSRETNRQMMAVAESFRATVNTMGQIVNQFGSFAQVAGPRGEVV